MASRLAFETKGYTIETCIECVKTLDHTSLENAKAAASYFDYT